MVYSSSSYHPIVVNSFEITNSSSNKFDVNDGFTSGLTNFMMGLPFQNLPNAYHIDDNASSFNFSNDMLEMEINEQDEIPVSSTADSSNLQDENRRMNYRKRRADYANDAPLCKRRVDRVSARLENFHISNDPGPSTQDWGSDSSSEDNGNENIEDDEPALILDEKLREFIHQERNAPSVIPRSYISMAVVPYVPPVSFDNPSMVGRIEEIDAEDAKKYNSSDNGVVTFPEEVRPVEPRNMDGKNEDFLSSAMNVTEIDIGEEDDVDMEIDS